MSVDHSAGRPDAELRKKLHTWRASWPSAPSPSGGEFARSLSAGVRGARSIQSVQLAHWAGEGKTRSQHLLYAVVDAVRGGVDAWQRFQAIARELADRNRARVWALARRRGPIR